MCAECTAGFGLQRTALKAALMIAALFALAFTTVASQAADPLPSWNDGPAKQSIIAFVEKVTKPGSPDFVPAGERIATFDNDGTLWCEQPMPVQLYFALDRVKALAPQHPEWSDDRAFRLPAQGRFSKGTGRRRPCAARNRHGYACRHDHGGIRADRARIGSLPRSIRNTEQPFTDMVYQPMLEVLAYLRANGFKNFIVSGGGIEFMRPWAEQVYGVPPEQVVGSSIKTKFELRDGKPVLVRLPELNFNDDKGGKPVGINRHIGRRPIAAFGNSHGDKEMLEYTQGGGGARFELLVLHDDAKREYAFGPALGLPEPKLGAFPQALYDQAKQDGWTVVSMKNDWGVVFPFEPGAVTAIDILLEPDAVMLRHAEAVNADHLKIFPQGFALDAAHRPHVTMIQRFVRTADLDKIYDAAGKVLARANVTAMKLEAFKFYYVPSGDLGLSGIVATPTPELLKLQQDLVTAVAPFTVTSGTSAAFVTTPDDRVIDPLLIEYVSSFVPKNTAERFSPHVSTGLAPRTYLDKLLAEPFELFTFSPAGAAVYQLGQFGTAARKLKEFNLKP